MTASVNSAKLVQGMSEEMIDLTKSAAAGGDPGTAGPVSELDEELLKLFTRDTSARIGQLPGALDRGDATMAADLAHAIKGSALTVGLSAVAAAAERLEDQARGGDLAAAAAELAEVRAAFERFQAKIEARRQAGPG